MKHFLLDTLFLTMAITYVFSSWLNFISDKKVASIGNLIIGVAWFLILIEPWPA